MRADRLISLIMLLQARGKSSARQLAEQLEVSERTIYRDMVVLSAMGVPVYGEAGTQGGYALVDSYRTSLTGLTEDEVQALFMLSVPEPLQALGVGQQLRAAILKLAAALPDERRKDEERVRQRYHLDWSWWEQGGEAPPLLSVIQQAVWQDQKLAIRYQVRAARSEVERLVEPYGLVAKAGTWYLVCAWQGRPRVLRISSLLEARLSDEHFTHPLDFDLASFWNEWRDKEEGRRASFAVNVQVAPGMLPALVQALGDSILRRAGQAVAPDAGEKVQLTLFFESHYEARNRLMAFGGGVEVLEPPALRASISDLAEQIRGLYAVSGPQARAGPQEAGA